MTDVLDPGAGTEQQVDPQKAVSFVAAELAPQAGYNPICIACNPNAKSRAGNAMIVLDLADPETPKANAKVYLVNTPSRLFNFNQVCGAFGVAPLEVGVPVDYKAADFVGKKVRAKGIHETFNDALQFKFDEITAPPEGAGFRVFEAGAEDIPF